MSRLGSILGISSLWNLRTLGLRGGLLLDVSLVKELELLEHLQVVTIDISSPLVVEPLLWSQKLVKCIKEVDFKYLEEEAIRVLALPSLVNIRRLSIKRCGMNEIVIEKTVLAAPYFPNLSKVFISKCHGLKDLSGCCLLQILLFLKLVSQSK
ncbi:unnamed protein product [Eruca vesicaria subsp. sativa]|uniref:Leucine-rich repeat domain, L domain-containing protein n=1 Tax=Eruca vesicaria subsp. sativa TaxID=29727 RepID=A0ABC8LYC6_ERUVS|nr:unnamed protein product [Eruca vesicaria subsp. sativa]